MSPRDHRARYRLALFDFPKTEALVTVREFGPAERLKRALQWGGALFGLAVLSVLIPIAHFVLVPGFLIAAIVLFVRRLGQTRTVVRVHGLCPRCAVEQDFELDRAPLEGELELTCVGCRNRIRAERANDAERAAGAPPGT